MDKMKTDGAVLRQIQSHASQNSLYLVVSKMATASTAALYPIFLTSKSPLKATHKHKASAPLPLKQINQPSLRRDFLKAISLLPLLDLKRPPPSAAKEIEVGSYLPPSPSDPSFVLFKASPRDTPALRAGTRFIHSFFLWAFIVLKFAYLKFSARRLHWG